MNLQIFRSPPLRNDELQVLNKIGEMYKSLKYMLSSPSRWDGVLRRNAFARAIRGSTSIEGYLVTAEDAIEAVEGGEPHHAEVETWQAVMGYRNAMTYVLQLSRDPNFILNEGFLRSFHFMMLQYDLTKNPGNWRPGSIYVRDEQREENVYEGPSAEVVPHLVEKLISYLRSPEDENHILVKAAMAHLNLAMIHPFSGGNGRMARCLQTLVFTRRGLVDPTFCSIEEYLGRNTQDYYEVLAEVGKGSWNPHHDTRPWIRFNMVAHFRQAGTALRRVRMIRRLWDELEREIKKRSLPDRVIFALSDAAMGYRVRSSRYRHNADVSRVVASRDLRALVETGLLVAQGEKRGRVYAGAPFIRDLAHRIRNEEPHKIPDPFETMESSG